MQINMGSIAPITASQFGTNRLMEKLLLQRSGQQELGTQGRFSCAAVAGTVSALVATPTELVIIQQQVCVRGRQEAEGGLRPCCSLKLVADVTWQAVGSCNGRAYGTLNLVHHTQALAVHN
jgi:hypothetical protein